MKMMGKRCAVAMHRLMRLWPLLNTLVAAAVRERLVSIYIQVSTVSTTFANNFIYFIHVTPSYDVRPIINGLIVTRSP
jgi:hypothetical protein